MPRRNWLRRNVYLVRDGDLHKIGSAFDPSERLPQVALTEGATIVHAFDSLNASGVEHALHQRFAHCRATDAPGREWFRLTPEDVAIICCLGRTDRADDLPDNLKPLHPPSETVRISGDLVEMLREIRWHSRDNRNRRPTLTSIVNEMLRSALAERK